MTTGPRRRGITGRAWRQTPRPRVRRCRVAQRSGSNSRMRGCRRASRGVRRLRPPSQTSPNRRCRRSVLWSRGRPSRSVAVPAAIFDRRRGASGVGATTATPLNTHGWCRLTNWRAPAPLATGGSQPTPGGSSGRASSTTVARRRRWMSTYVDCLRSVSPTGGPHVRLESDGRRARSRRDAATTQREPSGASGDRSARGDREGIRRGRQCPNLETCCATPVPTRA